MKLFAVFNLALCLVASANAFFTNQPLAPTQTNGDYGVQGTVQTFQDFQSFFPAGTFDATNDLLSNLGVGGFGGFAPQPVGNPAPTPGQPIFPGLGGNLPNVNDILNQIGNLPGFAG